MYDVKNMYPLFYDATHPELACAHAAIILEDDVKCDEKSRIMVLGLADRTAGSSLGTAFWPDCGWTAGLIGQRRDVSPEVLADVALQWSDTEKDVSRLGGDLRYAGSIKWSDEVPYKNVLIRSGRRTFISGTCVGYVEFCYEEAGLDLVADDALNLKTLPTTFQMSAFDRELYPFSPDLSDESLLSYPSCLAKKD